MDFLLITNQPPYPLTQFERNAIYQLAYELNTRRYIIDLVCFYSEPEDIAEVPRYEPLFRRVAIAPKPQPSLTSLQARLKKDEAHFPSTGKEAWSEEMWDTITEWVNDRAYGFVQLIGDLDIYEYHPLIKRIPNLIQSFQVPSQSLQYQIKQTNDRTQKQKLTLQQGLAQKYEPWLYATFEGRVLPTQNQTHYLQSQLPEQAVHTIPIGVDTEYYTPTGHDPRQAGILLIADFQHQASQHAALRLCERIFPQVKRAIPQLSIYILGKNPPKMVRALASDSIILIESAVDYRPYFELASVYVSPYESSIGLQHDLLKSLAMMTPIVASSPSMDGLELLQPDRDFLLANSDEDFIRAIIRLIRDDQTRHQLQRNGRDHLHEFYRWERIADQFEDLHEQITRQHGAF